MPPKKIPAEQPIDQGQLFPVEVSREHPAQIGEVVEGGVFPDELSALTEDKTPFHEAVHAAVVAEQHTRNRRIGQSGKHSTLDREGTYLQIKPGDFLPGFGPVKDSNWQAAKSHAQKLEAERQASIYAQPTLSRPEKDTRAIVAQTAAALAIERGLTDGRPTPASTHQEDKANRASIAAADFVEAGTQSKLEGLRDDHRAGFLPTTHREKSQAFELLDYMTPGKYERGVSTRLDQIFFRQQREMKKNGMTPRQAQTVAVDSVRSVIREWGDYLANARSSWTKLDSLQTLIDDTPNPNLTLETLLEDEGQGEVVTQLIRYQILRQRRDSERPLGFDPLWVRENRTEPTDDKHKTVEDVFVHKGEEFMDAYIKRRASEMTVGEVRRTVREAKYDQARRGKFWRAALESLDDDYQQYAKLAIQAV
ncbi:hypothetical protein H7097_01730 [Aeromicrobium sp.]|nr:hypothetical protein [Candidatus Saccharibacteria bacterium]